MKVKDARKLLEGYSSEELYKQGCKIFRGEVYSLITLRSYGKKPTAGVIESAINQAKNWFLKVAEGFPWSESGSIKNIINRESGQIWAEYGLVNPEIEKYRTRARVAIITGKPFPLLEALTPEALDAMSSMMLANLRISAKLYTKREEFAKGMGKRVCPYNEKERFCQYQSTFSMVKDIPGHIEDCVFVCDIDKCIKDTH